MDKKPKPPTITSQNDNDYSFGYSKKEVDALKTMLNTRQLSEPSTLNKDQKNNDQL